MATATYAQLTTQRGAGIFTRIYNGLLWIAENNSRVREAQRLQAMSDEALAARGLKREDIARHVFSDIFI